MTNSKELAYITAQHSSFDAAALIDKPERSFYCDGGRAGSGS